MQQERCRDGDVRVDRAQLQQQLRQFELDKEKMRNRNVDYSPRFRSGNDMKMTGSGDNRSSSPTFPINARVSGKEKRRRVHAWLGAQIRSETESPAKGECPPGDETKLPDLPAPDLPSFANPANMETYYARTDSDSSPGKGGSDLLQSKSEFIPGNVGPSYPINFEEVPPESSPAHRNAGLPVYTSSYNPPMQSQPLKGRAMEASSQRILAPDYTGGGDSYCYLYDPAVARAYTKKYSVSPSINTPPPSTLNSNIGNPHISNAPITKFAPASQNFTPSPVVASENAPLTRSYPKNSDNIGLSRYSGPYSSTAGRDFASPVGVFSSSHLPTKYEEYDMRPIKPLDADMKKSLYGETGPYNVLMQAPKVQQPKPYLRRSHTTGVSYPIPKARNHEKAIVLEKPVHKVQMNVEHKRKTAYMRGSPRPSPMSPRRRQLPRRYQKDKILKQDKKKSIENQEAPESESLEEIPKHDQDVNNGNLVQLPVDLKHVKAATKIQAVWKGYRTRRLDPKVVEIRTEVRARRAEQYISVLCHEVQCLKENLDAERKMKDLQTEAIRYIWSQLRALQKSRNGTTDGKRDPGGKGKSLDRRPRSKSNSPRRGTNRGNKRSSPHGSPHGSPREKSSGTLSKKHTRYPSESSALDFDEELESIVSDVEEGFSQKKADVSWKEVPDENIFQNKRNPIKEANIDGIARHSAEDTDEGRGTLVTDGEGNPAHSSAEEDSPTKATNTGAVKIMAEENVQLKTTIETLQGQVAQLQEAMLSLSDKILNRSRSDVNLNVWDEGEELKLASESQDVSMVASPPQQLEEVEQERPAALTPEPALSARGEVPRISLKNALTTLKSAVSENELWALCEQAGNFVKIKSVKHYLALENLYVRKDGRVEIMELHDREMEIDEMYLAPEVLEDRSAATVKSSVFSLSVVLWSAADWEMSAEQAPELSQDLESLLVAMSQDEVTQRAEVDDVIRICEDHHAKAGANSLCVCSSLFAEVEDALLLAKSGKLIHKKIAQEVSKDMEALTRRTFKEMVVPDIDSGTWKSNLKPASMRVLSPRPCEDLTPHEKLMRSLSSSQHGLKQSPRPKVFSVRDMFIKNPQLVQNLNILPGQRRKNQKAMQLVLRRQAPKDPASAPLPGIPTPPRALRAGVTEAVNSNGLSSVILRWHPAKIFDKHGQPAKEEKIIGYRIYVNGHPKGMVAGTKSRALLEGLRHLTEYRVNVRAISALGESDVSNTVIAHITSSSPVSRSLEVNVSEGYKPKSSSPQSTSPKNSTGHMEEKPVVQPTKDRIAPQAKPRLGAVFPKQSEEKKVTKRSKLEDSNCEEDGKSENQQADDVIDRVLRRYGIQQTAAIVPGYASGSTLSPIPTGYRPKSCTSAETNRKSVQSSLLEDMTKSLETSSVSSKGSTTSENPSSRTKKPLNTSGQGDAAPSTPTSADVTSKSLELLAQLKSELLS